ncbi:hypothetical protein UA08_03402 [Talaromyces atroroseus]|uniref:Xylanolytic transcriptional activator regulatory domain-containing protein n=1 Tax=Talaromyces atroroseus TaxID=1441469 RepID=A0A225APT0_TALAT|nr:hypothetical protein UA08_03402 [Talaromyces atroroseus]OKL61503.1 hypothetical protein UA08_03402 [Talaromyces atroroseus]
MQSFLQYSRLGQALEVQLSRDRQKLSQLRQQQRELEDGKRNGSPADENDLQAGPGAEKKDGPAQDTSANVNISLESVSSQTDQGSTDDQIFRKGDDIEPAEIPDGINLEELRAVPTHQTTGTMLGHAMSGITVRQRTTREGGPESESVFVVSWESEEDPLNPKNWGFAKRMVLTSIISLVGGIVGFAGAIDSAVIPEAAAEFGVREIIEALATGLFLIGFGFGGLAAGPLSETVGRNPIYIITMILYMLFLIGAGASPNIQSQLVCRFFAGIFGATPLVCAGGSLSDIWTPQERVFAFPLFACSSFLGPLAGPIVGDWIGQSSAISWRSTEWVTLIASGMTLILVCLVQPETYAPVLLGWKARHLRRLANDERFRGAIEIRDTSLLARLGRALYRPFLMFVQEPILVLFGLYVTVVYIVLFTFFTGYTYIFTDIYGLSQGMTGVCFVGEMVGVLSCSALIPLNIHLRKRDVARAKALGPDVSVAPESRLYWAMIGGPCIPISLFWMGWTARPEISIWSPLVASGFFGFGVLCVFMTTYQYLMDTYEVYAASALAGITFIRYSVSGAFIEISLPFYENMGVAYTLTVLGSLSAVLVLIPFAFHRYGPAIRKRSSRSRVSKRVHHACDNCRLYQSCRYNGSAAVSARSAGHTGRSLAQLEESMELMLESAIQQSMDSVRAQPPQARGFQSAVLSSPNGPESLPPSVVILHAIELYFRFCHRQPLWLFEREEVSSSNEIAEELIFALLALVVRFSACTYFEGSRQELSRRYGEVARGQIMFRIAQGAVKLSTIQGLCLLSFAYFTAKDTHLAWFHINLATSLANMADMNFETETGLSNSIAESRRRVFYSIFLLNQTYAPRSMLLNMLEDIENPKYLEPKRDPRRESGQLPPMTPRDSTNITPVDRVERAGIWIYMIQQSSLWREVRGYVSQCADGTQKPPWAPESGYAVIGAHLMELETRFPMYHRYDAVKFLGRSTEELQRNRDYWSPWLCIQIVYHAIHSVLNHPFLYSSRPNQSIQMSVPNTFWKTSSELAFLHSSWTVRLIDMVWEKDYEVSDPFLGHCAAIAATIHVYYCRATDIRVRTSAQSTKWPICQLIYDRLDSLVQSALGSKSQKETDSSNRRIVSINTGLMWDILDYTCPKTASPQKTCRGLFDPSVVGNNCPLNTKVRGKYKGNDSDENEDVDDVVETQIFHHPNPATEVDTSNGGQELPPYSGTATRRRRIHNSVNQNGSAYAGRSTHSAPAHERPFVGQQQHDQEQQETDAVIIWPAYDMWMSASTMDVSNDPFFQFQDHDMPWAGSWEIGNL